MSKSAVVRGASKAASIWNKLATAVKAKGGTDDAFDILDTKDGEGLIDSFAEQLVEAEFKTRDRFQVEIDYYKPLDTMIAECACDFNNPNITTVNFSITGTGVVEEEIILVHFNRRISSDDAIAELKKRGLEPAGLVHALAFGKRYSNVQRLFLIVFLGSVCVVDGHRHVPCLYSSGSGRGLYLDLFDCDWDGSYRFAAVRTISQKRTKKS